MPCYSPTRIKRNASGETGAFRRLADVPCGQCIGCKLERSRQWAVRAMHEASMHDRNCYLTLTIDDDHYYHRAIPQSLDIDDWQTFAKRLRKKCGPFRYLMSGEYGEKGARPHYHACIFGLDFPDMKYLMDSPSGLPLYRSTTLESLWTMGFSSIGSLTFESAQYVAKYCVKKITGPESEAHYNGRSPEFLSPSRKPGIGRTWFNKYQSDVFPKDEVIVRGKRAPVPRYYTEALNDEDKRKIKMARQKGDPSDMSLDRLEVRETVTKAKQRLYSGRKI